MSQKMNIFAVYDKKAQAYAYPSFYHQKGQAIRAFEDAVNDPQSPFHKHPADFVLSHLGEWDDSTGIIKGFAVPQHLEEAINLKTAPEK